MNTEIEAWIGSYMTRYHEALEQVCEAAIQGGKHGVLVLHEHRRLGTMAFTVSVSPEVPYGEIWERWAP